MLHSVWETEVTVIVQWHFFQLQSELSFTIFSRSKLFVTILEKVPLVVHFVV